MHSIHIATLAFLLSGLLLATARSLVQEWSIEPIGEPDVESNEKVYLEYNVSNKGEPLVVLHPASYVNIFGGNKTCNTSTTAENIDFTTNITNVSDTVDNLLVSVNFNYTDIEQANIYHEMNDTFGFITFCTKVSLFWGEMSVSFNERVVELKISKFADNIPDDDAYYEGGGGMAITLEKASSGSQTVTNTTIETVVLACICDSNDGCISPRPTLTQNSVMKVCVETESDTFEIERIVFMDLKQNSEIKTSLVRNGVGNGLADLFDYVGQDGKPGKSISTRLISSLFDTINPPPISVVGGVDLAFANARKLRAQFEITGGEEYARRDETEELHSPFGLTVELAGDDDAIQDSTIADNMNKDGGSGTIKEDSGSRIGKGTPITIIVTSTLVVVVAIVVNFDALGRMRRALPSVWKDMEFVPRKK
mmetsp:Transcript_7599/g.10336  ORF Transcript_7599/g.10336 Transcript_7599/m.10336 type:complete len:423 (-) Transcript_7599:26-1294(-)|eukprot:CAMPEP_0185732072 /NCGR_PEP_ID=MMETSP1171-20130828/14872_1 /TAXON_ID=374046 /ORGANISM="Helicotheca tamensis, Strain CCMP826" /LENGTH=422 /DNA_ID=CAMNT_0028401465 /DNA_START=118 /DNA_END=1386 /DNA_ORIENTATION=-